MQCAFRRSHYIYNPDFNLNVCKYIASRFFFLFCFDLIAYFDFICFKERERAWSLVRREMGRIWEELREGKNNTKIYRMKMISIKISIFFLFLKTIFFLPAPETYCLTSYIYYQVIKSDYKSPSQQDVPRTVLDSTSVYKRRIMGSPASWIVRTWAGSCNDGAHEVSSLRSYELQHLYLIFERGFSSHILLFFSLLLRWGGSSSSKSGFHTRTAAIHDQRYVEGILSLRDHCNQHF